MTPGTIGGSDHGEGVEKPQQGRESGRCPYRAKDTDPPKFVGTDTNRPCQRGRYHVSTNSEVRARYKPRRGVPPATIQRCSWRPAGLFFEGAPTVGKKQPARQEGELSEDTIVSFLGTREGAALVRAFITIKQKPVRQNVIAFLETLGK